MSSPYDADKSTDGRTTNRPASDPDRRGAWANALDKLEEEATEREREEVFRGKDLI